MGFFSGLFGKRSFNSEGYLSLMDRRTATEMWIKVEEQVGFGKPSNYRSAVIDADKILEFVLSKMYPKLSTTGERLKVAKDKFVGDYELYDSLWFAHKVRNELVHNLNFELPSSQINDVLEKFKAGLVKLGAL